MSRDSWARRLAGWARCPVRVGECQAYVDYGEDDQHGAGDVGEHDRARCRCREADSGPPVSVGPARNDGDQRPSGGGHGQDEQSQGAASAGPAVLVKLIRDASSAEDDGDGSSARLGPIKCLTGVLHCASR